MRFKKNRQDEIQCQEAFPNYKLMHQEESAPHVTGTHTALPCCFALKLVGFHTDQHVVRLATNPCICLRKTALF